MAYRCDIEELCERIYDAAIDADTWPDALDQLALFADSAWAAILTRRNDSWLGWRISPAHADDVDAYLRSDSATQSVTTARLFDIDHSGFVSDLDHFSEDERRSDAYFQWASAHGFGHGAATGFQLNSGDLAVVQLMRRRGEKPFGPAELQSIDCVRPHLARAALLAARWKMERLRAATEALGLVGLPAVVLSRDCRVMSGNALAEELDGHLIWLAKDRLGLIDNAAAAKLEQQVAASAKAGSLYAASSFPSWDASHTSPIVVHIIPLKGDRRDLFGGGLALVLFTPAGSPDLPDCEIIRELFDLTAAEARVAAQFAVGRSIDEIAGAHRVSVSTVRSQTKSILQKIGAHRQSEVAARLGASGTIRPRKPLRTDPPRSQEASP